MKANIILTNWSLSIFGLGMESTDGGMLWTLVGFAWFMISTLVLMRARRKRVFSNN